MKRKTAKEILTESFRELAETKSIDKITVRDITDNCGYSPATFYRQFKDKYDLIAWNYSQTISEIMGHVGEDNYQWRDTLLAGALYFDEQREYLINLLRHTSGHDAFILYMTEIHFRALENLFLRRSGSEALDEKVQMYVRLYCFGTVNLTCEWIQGRYKASPEELAEVYEQSLPAPLHQYCF